VKVELGSAVVSFERLADVDRSALDELLAQARELAPSSGRTAPLPGVRRSTHVA
jgi:hypothetical protein